MERGQLGISGSSEENIQQRKGVLRLLRRESGHEKPAMLSEEEMRAAWQRKGRAVGYYEEGLGWQTGSPVEAPCSALLSILSL